MAGRLFPDWDRSGNCAWFVRQCREALSLSFLPQNRPGAYWLQAVRGVQCSLFWRRPYLNRNVSPSFGLDQLWEICHPTFSPLNFRFDCFCCFATFVGLGFEIICLDFTDVPIIVSYQTRNKKSSKVLSWNLCLRSYLFIVLVRTLLKCWFNYNRSAV